MSRRRALLRAAALGAAALLGAPASALVCGGGPAALDVIGSSAATLQLDGRPVASGKPLPARARVAVKGGPVYIKVGERMLEIDADAAFSVRGNKVKVASGSITMINYAGMAITLNAGDVATFCDMPGDAPLNWSKPAQQIPSELLPSPPPAPIPSQNLHVVSPSAP